MAPTLQDVLASRSNISNKVILTWEMLQNEDVVSTFLSNIADKSRGYSHLTLDDNLKELFLVKEDNMKLEVETDLMQKKHTSSWVMVTLVSKWRTWLVM